MPSMQESPVRLVEAEEGVEEFYINAWEVAVGGAEVYVKLAKQEPILPRHVGPVIAKVKVRLVLSHATLEALTQVFGQNVLMIHEMYREIYGIAQTPQIGQLTPEQKENVNRRLREQAAGGIVVQVEEVSADRGKSS